MSAPKPPTPQGISALLRKAGFRRAEISIRGGCSGFRVTADRRSPGAVRVEWKPFLITSATAATRDSFLVRYRKTLIEAGWAVNPGEYDLTVTAPMEGER